MNPREAADRILIQCRGDLSEHKSNNKMKAENIGKQPTTEEEMTAKQDRIQLFQDLDSLRGRVMKNTGMKPFIKYGNSAAKMQAGNCMEYSATACVYMEVLNKSKGQKGNPLLFDAVYLRPDPYDHIFLVIGQPTDDGTYPKDMTTWHKNAAVCDGWANIACYATEFPQQWKQKMLKWKSKGKLLPMPKGEEGKVKKMGKYGQWVEPDDPVWYECIEKADKVSFTHQDEDLVGPKRGCCYITTATCHRRGLPDDCEELTILRRFRDTVLLADAADRADVAEYYATAPAIVAAIDARPDADAIYDQLYDRLIRPAVNAVENGDAATAKRLFADLVRGGWEQATAFSRLSSDRQLRMERRSSNF